MKKENQGYERRLTSNNGTRWTTKSEYVDIETGEELTRTKAEKEYIIINKNKRHELNANKTAGLTTITNECRRNPQGKLF